MSHRFYLPPEQCEREPLVLTGGEAHHALRVLRLRRGERVTVLDGAGRRFECGIEETERSEVRLAVVEKHSEPPPPCALTLLQGVPKGKIFDAIIQKATELGVAQIVPLLTERTVPHLEHKTGKSEKWQSVAIEAIKQCGAAWLPKVEAAMAPAEWLARGERFEMPLIASLQPGSRHPRGYFEAFRAAQGRSPRSACVWVGPEGDFTPAEVAAVQAAGGLPITLGPLVLRSETAAAYCLSVLNYELRATP